MANIELWKAFNEEATKERLKRLHEQLSASSQKEVSSNMVYDILAYEPTPNAVYSLNTEEEFRNFYSPGILIPQSNPELYVDYGETLYEAFDEGDYFSYTDSFVLSAANQRMIVNLRTQAAAMQLASELRTVSGMYNSFKFYAQNKPGIGMPVPIFKFDKMVIYYLSTQQQTVADQIARTRVSPSDFLPEMSGFYNIYRIDGPETSKFTVGIGKERGGGLSFSDYCSVYAVSFLSGVDPEIVKRDLDHNYAVKQEHLDKTAEKFSEDLFLHVHAQIA